MNKLLALTLLCGAIIGCSSQNEEAADRERENVSSLVDIGDDIFKAKEILISEGFRIKYGPDFPTKTERYLMMIVDYGLEPGGIETFKYIVGLESNSGPMSGIIKATPNGVITSIE